MKKSTFFLFLLIIFIVIGIVLFFLAKQKGEKAVVAPQVPKEVLIADFKSQGELQLVPYKTNNVEGSINISNDVLELHYLNDTKKRDIFAFYIPLNKSNVKTLLFRVRIYQGTYFTVDVTVDGKLLSPRPINYHKGTGEWEELSIPIGGTLNSISISIGEPTPIETQKEYRAEIDWIKLVPYESSSNH
jgi:hypothetical protein